MKTHTIITPLDVTLKQINEIAKQVDELSYAIEKMSVALGDMQADQNTSVWVNFGNNHLFQPHKPSRKALQHIIDAYEKDKEQLIQEAGKLINPTPVLVVNELSNKDITGHG